MLVRLLKVQDSPALRAVVGLGLVEFAAHTTLYGREVFSSLLEWGEVIFPEDGVVCVLVDEVAVRAEHSAVRGPAEVALRLALVEDPVREYPRGAGVPENVGVKRFVDSCSGECPRQERPDGRVLHQAGDFRVLVVYPQRTFRVIPEGVVREPLREVWGTAHDEWAALSCFAGYVERVAVLVLRDVF